MMVPIQVLIISKSVSRKYLPSMCDHLSPKAGEKGDSLLPCRRMKEPSLEISNYKDRSVNKGLETIDSMLPGAQL